VKLGGIVIAVVSTAAKGDIARRCGAQHVVLSTEDVAARARSITNGVGVDVSYDSVGKDSFDASLNSIRPLGMFVSYGNASGPIAPFAPLVLTKAGSLFFTRPSLVNYVSTPGEPLRLHVCVYYTLTRTLGALNSDAR
jgi:NADPH2:quinone reductase